MKIVCVSDTHNKHKNIHVGSGDILIHAGDATGRGKAYEIKSFLEWYGSQKYTYKILVAGNHDFGFENDKDKYRKMCAENDVIYLEDSGVDIVDIDTGDTIKVWGSPVQPEFFNWAFNRRIDSALPPGYDPSHSYEKINPWIKPHWDKIPKDTDILITHGPPKGIRDKVNSMYNPNQKISVGCPWLKKAVEEIKPKLHVFGHIHGESGVTVNNDTAFCNAAILNDRYDVCFKPREFKWQKGQVELK